MDQHAHACACAPTATGTLEHDAACRCEIGHPSSGAVTVTINPEARVSVVCARQALPRANEHGQITLLVDILNRGFVTMPLKAILLEPTSMRVSLDFATQRLSGVERETRELTLTLHQDDPIDITIGFRLFGEEGDLGGRDRFHFLAYPAENHST